MHVEPEASTHVSTVLESQLVILKMLSESLPKGWYVYVKEHPAQFYVNNDVGYYHMFDAPLFKTKRFYNKIASMPNMKIIDMDTKSVDLIRGVKAIASIVGTVFFESILEKKPILVFSDLNPATYVKDAFAIHSYSDCEAALKRIENGFMPQYDDADFVINKYIFRGCGMPDIIPKVIDIDGKEHVFNDK